MADVTEVSLSAAGCSAQFNWIGCGECPLWVKSRHRSTTGSCPLYPQKRTLVERVGMSALCQKRTLQRERCPLFPRKRGRSNVASTKLRHRAGFSLSNSNGGFVWLRHLQACRLPASTVIRSARSRSRCSATAISRLRSHYSVETRRAQKNCLRPLSCPRWVSRPQSTNGSSTPAKNWYSSTPGRRTCSPPPWVAYLRISPPPASTRAQSTPL